VEERRTNKYRRNPYATDIVIPVFNQVDLAYKCIDSIQKNTPYDQYQITLIDNGSHSASFRYWIEEKFVNLNVLHLTFNHGFIRATNAGIALSLLTDSEFVLLLNSDTEIPAGDTTWLERLTAPMAFDEFGAVGAVSNNVAGRQKRKYAGTGYGEIAMLIGFCMLLRKSAIAKVGLLDEQFEPGNFDDFDYSLRLQKAGYKLAVAESVFVQHVGHASFKALDTAQHYDSLLKGNLAKLKEKWSTADLESVGLL
jgi:GT2 family glycosyltransferase